MHCMAKSEPGQDQAHQQVLKLCTLASKELISRPIVFV